MKDPRSKLIDRIIKEKDKRKKIEEQGKRVKEPNLKAISDALDEFYFLDKIRLYCAYLSYSKIINPNHLTYQKNDFHLMQQIIEQLQNREFTNELLALYNNIRLLYENIEKTDKEADKRYIHIFQILKKNNGQYSLGETEELYSFLINYAIRRMNNGSQKYRENYFIASNELVNFKYGKRGKKRSKLPGSVFKNTVAVAIYLKSSKLFHHIQTEGLKAKDSEKGFADAYEWLEAYIPHYGGRLSKKDQQIYIPYCQAALEFSQKKFIQAYRTLKNPTGIRLMFMNMNIKMLYLKTLYEIYVSEPSILEADNIEIEKVLESYRGLIRDELNRKKELAYQIEFYSTFEKYFRQTFRFYCKYSGHLYNKKNPTFIKQKEELTKAIESVKYPCRGWLLEKLLNIK